MPEQPLRRVVREIADDEVFIALAFERVHTEPIRAEREQCEHERDHPTQDAARDARADHERIDLREPGFDLGLQILRRFLAVRSLSLSDSGTKPRARAASICAAIRGSWVCESRLSSRTSARSCSTLHCVSSAGVECVGADGAGDAECGARCALVFVSSCSLMLFTIRAELNSEQI